MTFIATTASAQSIAIHDETNGGECSTVSVGANHTVTGGCLLHGVSEDLASTLSHTGISEVLTTSCETELNLRGGPTGGHIVTDDTTIHTNPLTGCLVTPCDEAAPGHEELEWPVSGLFEYGSGREALIVSFCIRVFNTQEGPGSWCTIAADIVGAAEGHQQEISADSEPCFENPALELSGHWLGESELGPGEVDVELEHIHYP